MTGREAKDTLYAQFGRIARATSSPRRIELLELLAQAERSVEELASMTGMEVGNTSAQLQVLAQARLVERRRHGKRVLYRIADEGVARFLAALRELARARLAEVEQVARDYFGARDLLEPVSLPELMARIERGETVVVDVRPAEEFAAGHIPGAISLPLDELRHRLVELPPGAEIVAYCRGPYCVLAPQAVEILRRAGFRARRLADGLPEWRLAGLPVEVGVAPRSG
ncbi:MAG TPA: metalloregulator ArsR/SmtB family transcription factor [Candidatus Dormibacteraeota bacterium]|nr:metalloregulator ArsR/SmtB family transcription factor [Candidatus Dormibacteraeota bacterium]